MFVTETSLEGRYWCYTHNCFGIRCMTLIYTYTRWVLARANKTNFDLHKFKQYLRIILFILHPHGKRLLLPIIQQLFCFLKVKNVIAREMAMSYWRRLAQLHKPCVVFITVYAGRQTIVSVMKTTAIIYIFHCCENLQVYVYIENFKICLTVVKNINKQWNIILLCRKS